MAIACRYRSFALAVALLAWAGVVLQLVLTAGKVTAGGQSLAWALVIYLGYFTVLTNILAAVAVSGALLLPGTSLGRSCQRPGVVTAIAAAISVVGLSYFLLLRQTWDPQGWQLLADVLLHYVMPALFVAYWWLTVSKAELSWRQVPAWTIYPLAYLVYMLVRGEITGLYPYPFADVPDLGYPAALANSAKIFAFFVVMALLFVGLGRRQAQRSESL